MDARLQGTQHLDEARVGALEDDDLLDVRPDGAGGVEVVADEHHVALLRHVLEHDLRHAHDALEEAVVQLVHVAADDDDEVGAVARLGERGHDPAARLHDLDVAVLALAQRVIDDAARLSASDTTARQPSTSVAMPP